MTSTATEQVDDDSFVDELQPETQLMLGQYTIQKYLNAGGFGITYLATDSLDRTVVIKECFPGSFCRRSHLLVQARSRAHTAELRSIVRLFTKEAQALAKLKHPYIVGVHQVFEDNNTAYMALDFVNGRDLLDIIEKGDMKLTPDQIKSILEKVLDAIGFVHDAGLLHRDISPDNIIVDENFNPVLIDFGAAREQATKATRALSALRVVKDGYSPQEFYIAGSEQGPSSDLYSLAASFYHVITGELPPDSQVRIAAHVANEPDPYVPLSKKTKDFDAAFCNALDSAMAILPKDRVENAAEWLAIMSGDKKLKAARKSGATPKQSAKAVSGTGGRMPLLLASVAAIALIAGGAYVYVEKPELLGIGGNETAATAPTTPAETPAPVETVTAPEAEVVETVEAAEPEPTVPAPVEEPTTEATAPVVEDTPAEVVAEEDATPVPPAPEEGIATAPVVEPPLEETLSAEVKPEPRPVVAEPLGNDTQPETTALSDPQPTVPSALQNELPNGVGIETSALDRSLPSSLFNETAPDGLPVAETSETAEFVPAPEPQPVAEAEPVVEPAPAPQTAAPEVDVATGWSVDLPFQTDAFNTVLVTRPGAPFWLTPGTKIVEFNGVPVETSNDLVLARQQSDLSDDGQSAIVSLTVEGASSAQQFEVPVVYETTLANGTEFKSRVVDGVWQTTVSEAPTGSRLQAGDVIIANLQANEYIDGYRTLADIISREIEAGQSSLTLAIQRDGSMWVESVEIQKNSG